MGWVARHRGPGPLQDARPHRRSRHREPSAGSDRRRRPARAAAVSPTTAVRSQGGGCPTVPGQARHSPVEPLDPPPRGVVFLAQPLDVPPQGVDLFGRQLARSRYRFLRRHRLTRRYNRERPARGFAGVRDRASGRARSRNPQTLPAARAERIRMGPVGLAGATLMDGYRNPGTGTKVLVGRHHHREMTAPDPGMADDAPRHADIDALLLTSRACLSPGRHGLPPRPGSGATGAANMFTGEAPSPDPPDFVGVQCPVR